MVCYIDDKIYDMITAAFKTMCESIEEQKTDRYFIYCLVNNGIAMFIDEVYDTKEELKKQVLNYVSKGFKVKFCCKDDD